MIQLGLEYLIPGGTAGAGGAGGTEDQRLVGQAGKGTGLYCRGADLLQGDGTKELTKTFNRLLDQRRYRLGGAVATGDAGAAGADNDMDLRSAIHREKTARIS